MQFKRPSRLNKEALIKAIWLGGVASIFFMSGMTSLAYEVLWARMLSMQFGISIFGVVLAVAAFMVGLGMGSLKGVRWARCNNKPLMLFAILEISIAIYALMLPNMLKLVGEWMNGIALQMTFIQWYLLQGTEGFCLLMVPAFAMGVSFALVLKIIEHTPLSLGKVYGLNTMGGAVGALYPLWSLPILGWTNSVRVVALLGLAIGTAAFILSKIDLFRDADQHKTRNWQQRPPLYALIIYAGIGAGSIMLEIGWVRLYGMIMLRTEYVLAVILAVFLLGIAIGSIILPRVHKQWITVLMPFAVGCGVLLGLYFLPYVSAWLERSQLQSLNEALWKQALLLAAFTFPITLTLGAWLPFLAIRYENTGSGGAWLYGVNCLGGGLGAIIACLVGLPLLGSVGVVVFSGLAITALGLIWGKSRFAWMAFAIMLAAAWPLRKMPPVQELLPKLEADSVDMYLYEDAVSLTHVVQRQDGQRILLSDLQRMDASSEPSAAEIQKDQARLALLLHPLPRNVLFLGVGTGISLAGSKPFPGLERSAVELSQGAIASSRKLFTPVNGGIMDQVNTKRDDARHYLNVTRKNFDVIVGDLFHPDLAGMGSLLSVQQFQRVRNHLSDNGIFVQWLALNQFDIKSLEIVLRSFRKIFPNGVMFMDGMHLALVGQNVGLTEADAMLKNLNRMTTTEQINATGKEGPWTWLGRYWGAIPENSGPVQDEWIPNIEFNLPRARYDGSMDLAALLSWLLNQHPDAETASKNLAVKAEDKSKFGRAYVATELMTRGWIAAIEGNIEKAGELTWMANQANPEDRWIANALADNMLESLNQASQHGLSKREALKRILEVSPDYIGALRLLWHLELSEGNESQAERYRQRLLDASPLDFEASRSQATL